MKPVPVQLGQMSFTNSVTVSALISSSAYDKCNVISWTEKFLILRQSRNGSRRTEEGGMKERRCSTQIKG